MIDLNYVRKVKSKILHFEKNATFVAQMLPDSPNKSSILRVRITPHEQKIISQIKDKYQISDREIFEIICNGECGGEMVTGHVKRGRQGCQIKKEVQIPRRILTKKKT